jgi:hypothetical protein
MLSDMRHTRREVLDRTRREFARLDRLVARLRLADWNRRVPRPPTRDPWTVKDALAHIVYDVNFPLFEKVVTRAGAGQSPVYANLQKQSGELPGWNFGKYLVARDGRVVKFYPSRVTPDDAGLRKDIETALATR